MIHYNFIHNFRSFVAARASRQVLELYAADLMINLGSSMAAVFEPIYLYTRGFSLSGILYFFLGIYGLYFFLMPLGAKFARRFGYEKAMFLASPFLVAYYVFLYLIPQDQYFVLAAVVALALEKTFYWPAYHADLAFFGRNRERGREVGNILAINSLVYILGPFLGGIILTFFGFKALFLAVAVLTLASNIPLLTTPERFKPKPFSYWHAYRRLFYKENRRNFFGFLGFGEELIALVIWPIFIYTVIKSFISIGALVAITTLITTAVLLYVGRLADGGGSERRSILKIGTVFSGATWFLRLLIGGALGVFLMDALARITKNVIVVPMMAMTYDRASETSVMKTVVFFEMSLVAGKIFAIWLALLALRFFSNSFAVLFILAGMMTFLYALVKYEPVKLKS